MRGVARPVVVAAVVGALVVAPVTVGAGGAGAVEGLPYNINAYDFAATDTPSSTTVSPLVSKGQPFTATETGTLDEVSVPVVGVQADTTLTVEVQQDDGFPGTTGASLASASQPVAADGTVTFDLSGSAATITDGEGYVLLLGASSGQASLVIDDNSGSGVPNHWNYFTATWSEVTGLAVVATVSVTAYDADDPTVSAELSPPSPDGTGGWYVTSPTVTYTCDDATTWVVDCPDSGVVQDGEFDLAQTVTDFAGNTGSTGAVPVKVDTTGPTLMLSTDREPNGFGWFKTKVVVSAECFDDGSGVGDCPGDITFLATITASRTASDVAGNDTTETLRVKVDFKAPIVKVTNVRDGAVYQRMPRPKCEASDGNTASSSGIRSCEVDVKRLRGTRYAAIATAKDRAGWVSTDRKVFRVRR